jgi:dihydroorotate dehydrogenase
LGINTGKNATTPVENAVDDYLIALQKVYAHADYVTVNISSPNTPGLRNLQFGDTLNLLLERLKGEQLSLQRIQGRYVPMAVKIAPDMDDAAIKQVADILLAQGMDGVIATNTTVGREGVEQSFIAQEAGGLSGLPVQVKSTQVIAALHSHLGGKLPIIGVGGILDGKSATEKIKAGASLVQLYSGFIYQGPRLVSEAAAAIAELSK